MMKSAGIKLDAPMGLPTLPPAAHRPLAPVGDLTDLTDGWLRNRRLSAHTRSAYRRDVTHWLRWCAGRDIDPMAASFLHVNAYARELESTVDGRTGRPTSPATVARRLSGVSSWYDFLARLGALAANPVAGADRPRVDRDHSATVGLTAAEVDALLVAADRGEGPLAGRHRAMLARLAALGLRVGELVGLDVADLGHERGHRIVRFIGKGGRPRRRALGPGPAAAPARSLAGRPGPPDGPLFVTEAGNRVDRHAVFRLVRRLARAAGI